ncbi:MAG: lysophospholipid acyltransferase family protein [Deltaproteobacteria bacterium]|nr:lysophospholipid acyltransferase family protein [Deltaproteobacteria bacterium]
MRRHILDTPVSYYAIYFTVRYLPIGLCHWLGKVVVLLVYAFSRKDRNGLAYNLSLALNRPTSDPLVRRTVRMIFVNYGRYMVDFFLIPQLPAHKTREFFADVQGEPILRDALDRGKGAVFVSAHVGNWEIGGSLLRLLNYPLAVVALAHNTGATNILVNSLRRSSAIDIIEMDPLSPLSALQILNHLRMNKIVAMAGDREFFGRGRPVTYFGKKVAFPVGPVMVAMKSGAPVIPVFIIKQPDGRYTGILEEAIFVDDNGGEAIDAALGRLARVFETYIRRYPDQWYCPDPIDEGGTR